MKALCENDGALTEHDEVAYQPHPYYRNRPTRFEFADWAKKCDQGSKKGNDRIEKLSQSIQYTHVVNTLDPNDCPTSPIHDTKPIKTSRSTPLNVRVCITQNRKKNIQTRTCLR